MKKIKTVVIWILGALSAFFYVLNKSKSKQIEKQKDEADRYRRAAEIQGYIAEEERTARHVKDSIARAPEPDIDGLLDQTGSYRD